ncbi:hypothetical protein B0H65DRAFT_149848 [Neurospora tetraspora]|uniref:Microbial-type PARG catalytic domain-containing protein n=1 Tax=Neurospora tetraspora TaxID=94610 RepID=A0AAE0JGK8_9PEZI|nr:hypothetical protein B0H65DRAFT_149848 [Neurospora tetraspora]
MAPGSSRSSRPKPSEVAAETKRQHIPYIRSLGTWDISSYLLHQPLAQINFQQRPHDIAPPQFFVYNGDPVDCALNWAKQIAEPHTVAFICAANDKRPGGDWETGAVGYEERLCRRSTLSANLATPAPGSTVTENYPIPSYGGIYSRDVVVFRGPHDRYEKLPPEQWQSIPVVSVHPTRWPKLTQNGTKFSFQNERDMLKDLLRGALRIAAYNGHTQLVIGDFGLGNGYRNPPQEVAEMWREVLLYDPDLRGRISSVAFVFEDPNQSTSKLILEDLAKKARETLSSAAAAACPSDLEVFHRVFHDTEIQRVVSQPDSRYGLNNLLAS